MTNVTYGLTAKKPGSTPCPMLIVKFDTVGLVIWPVKIVPEMTYYVSSRMLNRTHSLTMYFCGYSEFGCSVPVHLVTFRDVSLTCPVM